MMQNITNLCVKCETKFVKWAEYHAHMIANTCHRQVKPFNVSGRPTGVTHAGLEAGKSGTIVGDWELKNKGAIIQ